MTGDPRNNVSVVIVNYDKIDTTIKCVDCVQESTGDYVREIIVVDNGSPAESVSVLASAIEGKARLVALGVNRYFGEGNNIGVEEATGEFILLLNNDAYVEPTCIQELVRSMQEDPSIAAAGPMFLYPNGVVQEVGGIALETGDVVQVGKGAIWGPDHYTEQCTVDYCSAACLLMRKQDFVDVGGFALQWEPAYYEDVDLCLMFWHQVGSVVVNPRARVVHLESLTTGDRKMRLESQVAINRLTFVEKWGKWLKAKQGHRPSESLRPTATGEAISPPAPRVTRDADGSSPTKAVESVVLYDPYELIPGGGERVLFELASVLVDAIGAKNVRIATPHRYSDLRTEQLSHTFGVNVTGGSTTLEDLQSNPPDMTVVLGNEVVPPIPGCGRYNIYVCQFPFHADISYIRSHAEYVSTFDEIWVYSNFVRRYVNGHLRLLGLRSPAVRVIYPPATIPRPDKLPAWGDRAALMTVGRFFKGGHNKRQDVVIEIARQLADRFDRSVPLVVAGSLHASAASRERFNELQVMAEGLNCQFYPNVSRERLIGLYANASVLVHAAGYGIDQLAFPERLEHFGIAPIEAASVGCIPVVFAAGGPLEVMDLLGSPTTFRSVPEAVERINGLFSDCAGAESLSRQLMERSELFSRQVFAARVHEALAEVL